MLDFKTIYDKYWAPLVYYGFKKTSNREEAEDIVQEIFSHLHIHNFINENAVRYYLYTSVKYRAINYHTRTVYKTKIIEQYFEVEEDCDLVETEFITLVYHHMASLPGERLKIFKLIFFEGYGLQEVADLLHLSINTVKSQRAKALIQLRKSLV